GHGTLSTGARFSVNSESYTFQRVTNPFFINRKVLCVFQSGTFAAVGGTITSAAGGADIVGQPFVVYFSGQAATHPDIDPALPDFPATCPSTAPGDAIFHPVNPPGFIKYAT